jgi:chemotaxis protein CheZ
MSTQANLGSLLLNSLIDLRQQKQQISIEDVGELFEKMASTMQGGNEADNFIRAEINRMAQYIDQAKQEIMEMRSGDAANEHAISGASIQLDAVIKATEEASNTIMDAADQIQAAAAGIGGEKEQQIMDASMKIYEACNFQDLTGQRINKVIAMINVLDEKIHRLVGLFSESEAAAAPAQPAVSNVIKGQFSEKDLLNGPQLKPPSQADIDALFGN